MDQSLEELKLELDILNTKEFSGVDLKTFISYLTLCDPTITHAKIAKILGITPVALSRSLNSTSSDSRFKEEWCEKLLDAFSYIDIGKARDNWNNLLKLVTHIERRKTYLVLADLMIQYLNMRTDGFCFNPKSYSLSPEHLLFERGEEKWVIFIQYQKVLPMHSQALWMYPRSTEMQKAGHFSVICLNNQIYNSYAKPRYLPYNLFPWKENFKIISTLLVSRDLDRVEKETVLYDAEKGIDFPGTVF